MIPTSAPGSNRPARTSGEPSPPKRRLYVFVLAVSLCGTAVLVYSGRQLFAAPLNAWALVLAVLTVVSGRFVIRVPGQPATVTVSEIFLFASVLLYGPAPATITVALDGLWTSAMQEKRQLYRAAFNVAEPALSTFAAGWAFFAVAGTQPFGGHPQPGTALTLPALALSSVYFIMNGMLQALAVTLENGGSPFSVWRQHAPYLALNYYAAGSLATLAVKNADGPDLDVVGLVAPLLILSYGAYKAAANRIEESQRHIGEVERLYHATVEMMAIAVDAKDQVTHGHIRRVQRHTLAVAKRLGVTEEHELKALEAASLLHDIGKLAVPDYVLNKPGALTASEFDTMKQHAAAGAKILSAVEFPYPVVPIVRAHHEQWCGKGYPDGLAGEDIPLGARILSVVDCFDATTSDRPYRRRMTDEAALQLLRDRRGNMYDPRVVDAFLEMVPELREADRVAEAHRVQAPLIDSLRDAAIDTLPRADNPLVSARHLEVVDWLLRERLAGSTFGAEACFFLYDSRTDFVSVACTTPRLHDAAANLRMRNGEGLAGWVASNRHTIVNSNADLDLGPIAARFGLGACTATPVLVFGQLVGVLSAYLTGSRRFTDEETKAVGLTAQDIGLLLARERRRGPRAATTDVVV